MHLTALQPLVFLQKSKISTVAPLASFVSANDTIAQHHKCFCIVLLLTNSTSSTQIILHNMYYIRELEVWTPNVHTMESYCDSKQKRKSILAKHFLLCLRLRQLPRTPKNGAGISRMCCDIVSPLKKEAMQEKKVVHDLVHVWNMFVGIQ